MLYARLLARTASPSGREPFAGVAELVDALDLGSSDDESWGFEPLRPHHGTAGLWPPGRRNASRRSGRDPMQVTQTLAEGLKREFKVVVPAADLASRANQQLEEMKDKVRINGFRPGKVPVAHLKRLYGRSVMADIVNSMVGEANKKIVDDNHIKLAMEPKLDFEGGDEGVKSVLEGSTDFAWTVSVEVLPAFEIGDVSGIAIEKPVASVEDGEIQARLDDLARRNVAYT